MTSTDAQVRIVMTERSKGRTQQQAAVKANLNSRNTVRKYERLGQLPSELKQPRTYRTRENPFAADWSALEAMLEAAPELSATTLFEWLGEHRPGVYPEGQLRTLQRQVSRWRALHTEKVVALAQDHRPGEVLQTDGTWMNTLGITVGGQAFPHLLIHSVLPYSNWEWGRVAQSESLLAIRLGLQSTLAQLGHVPAIHQTDNTTAATHQLGPATRDQSLAERGYNAEYLHLLAHFGMEPRTIHVGAPNENGDIEAANGAFKRAVAQHLWLRGSRDFANPLDYERFLWQVLVKRNAQRQVRLAEELAVMKPLTMGLLPDQQEVRPRVSAGGTIRVLNNVYSVPSGLIGKLVTARISEWQIEIWYASQCVDTFPRLIGLKRHQVNYRHVIDTLLRKPGGFRDYRYRDDLFPRLVFRQAWEALQQRFSPRRADLAYLRVLKLAAAGSEQEVAAVLAELLTTAGNWDDTTVAARLPSAPAAAPALQPSAVDLAEYDHLLGPGVDHDRA